MGSRVSEGINLYRTLGYIVCCEEDAADTINVLMVV